MDYIVQSQHNQKCPLISKDKSFLKGGQFAPAETEHFDRQKVVNLLRRRLDILSGVSTGLPIKLDLKPTSVKAGYSGDGPHALRHSLAGRLLERQTILPVISEVLGHENTESTRFYLRIDLTSLRQCVLEVPGVSPGFYAQEGGWFYE